jgi:hypothetical protein
MAAPRAAVAAAARRRFTQRFTAARMTAETASLFRSVLRARSPQEGSLA